MTDQSALERLDQRIGCTIGRDPRGWSAWPGGWPGEAGTALIDAVFSARALYTTKHGRGIHPLVARWRERGTAALTDLDVLADEIEECGPAEWGSRFGNSQHSPSRKDSDPGGPSKAATVLQAARGLSGNGVNTAEDIDDDSVDSVKRLLRCVPGIGYATANYFLMLLGRPGVKPDRMVHRFLREATGRSWSNASAEELITAAAGALSCAPHELEHAIWSYERRHPAANDD